MKRFKIFTPLLTLCLIVSSFVTMAGAECGYNWYIKRNGQCQPNPDTELFSLLNSDSYYIDKSKENDKSDKVIYLTFDAGYENGNVEKIMNVLKEEGVSAAFFILDHIVLKNTDLVKRMVNEGHTVCNHTARHKDMSTFSNEAFLEELHTMEALYREHTGFEMSKYYRPPEGTFSRENLVCANENGYKTIFWSFAYPDWDNNKQMDTEKAKQIILDNIHNGEVMLLHPTSSTNASILQEVIQTLKAEGYRFGTLDELTGAESQ